MFFKKHAAECAFPPIVAFGSHSSMPHYNSLSHGAKENQSQALKFRDIVLLDFGARVEGYCADMTRMIFVGDPTPEWIQAYKALLHAQQAAILSLRAHFSHTNDAKTHAVNGSELDVQTRTLLRNEGFPEHPHTLGHGLGLDIHETPRLSQYTDSILEPGMVITIEPGIYIPELFGMRIEDTIALTDSGIEVLTASDKTMIIK